LNFPATVEIWIVWDFSKLVFWFGMIIISGVLLFHCLQQQQQQWNRSNEALREGSFCAQGKDSSASYIQAGNWVLSD
jgi:hypothetical protein